MRDFNKNLYLCLSDSMVIACKLPKTYLVSESTIRRMIVRLYGKNSEYLAEMTSELVVLGFDERKDWTKQADGKDVQETHITFTDEKDYVDHGTVEKVPKDCTEKFKGSENCFKQVWKVTEKSKSEQSIIFMMCDGCNTNSKLIYY